MAVEEISNPDDYPEVTLDAEAEASNSFSGQCRRFSPFAPAFMVILEDGVWISCKHTLTEGHGPHMYKL